MTAAIALATLLVLAACQTVALPNCTHHCVVVADQKRGNNSGQAEATVLPR